MAYLVRTNFYYLLYLYMDKCWIILSPNSTDIIWITLWFGLLCLLIHRDSTSCFASSRENVFAFIWNPPDPSLILQVILDFCSSKLFSIWRIWGYRGGWQWCFYVGTIVWCEMLWVALNETQLWSFGIEANAALWVCNIGKKTWWSRLSICLLLGRSEQWDLSSPGAGVTCRNVDGKLPTSVPR